MFSFKELLQLSRYVIQSAPQYVSTLHPDPSASASFASGVFPASWAVLQNVSVCPHPKVTNLSVPLTCASLSFDLLMSLLLNSMWSSIFALPTGASSHAYAFTNAFLSPPTLKIVAAFLWQLNGLSPKPPLLAL